jgi:hypothetical protein
MDDGGGGCTCTSATHPDEENMSNSESAEAILLWLPRNSVFTLVNGTRYNWTHDIRYVHGDVVENQQTGEPEWMPRGFRRISITLKELIPGADVVGSSLA